MPTKPVYRYLTEDVIRITLEDNLHSEPFETLIDIIIKQDIDTLKQYLTQERYQRALNEPQILAVHPLTVAMTYGDVSVIEALLQKKPALSSKILVHIFSHDTETICIILNCIKEILGAEALQKAINGDELKDQLLRMDNVEIFKLCFEQYGLTYLKDNATSIRYWALPDSEIHQYLLNQGVNYTPHDTFLIQLTHCIETNDYETVNRLLKEKPNQSFITEEIFLKVLSSFEVKDVITSLNKMASNITFDTILEILNQSTFVPIIKKILDNPDKEKFVYQHFASKLQSENIDRLNRSDFKSFSHALGLSGKLSSMYDMELEGSDGGFEDFGQIVYLINRFKNSKTDQATEEHLQKIEMAFRSAMALSYYFSPDLCVSERNEQLEEGKLIILPCTSTKHLFGVNVIKITDNQYMASITNRGIGTRFSGSEMFEMPQHQARAIIDQFSVSLYHNSALQKDVSQQEMNQKFYSIVGKTPKYSLPANIQKFGTCGFVNPKRCVESGLFMLALQQNNRQMQKNTPQLYRRFSLYSKKIKAEQLCTLLSQQQEDDSYQALAIKYILLQHDSSRDKEEIAIGKRLLPFLPTHIQALLNKVIKTKNGIAMAVDNMDQLPMMALLAQLCDRLPIPSGVLLIHMDGKKVTVKVKPSKEVKYRIRGAFSQELISLSGENLTLDIENAEGYYQFYINNLTEKKLDAILQLLSQAENQPPSSSIDFS